MNEFIVLIGGPAVVLLGILGIARWCLNAWKEAALAAAKVNAETTMHVAIERIRGETQTAVDLARIQHTSFMDRRFTAIEGLYLKIVSAEQAARTAGLLFTLKRSSDPIDAFMNVLTSTSTVISESTKARIWLSPESYDALQELSTHLAANNIMTFLLFAVEEAHRTNRKSLLDSGVSEDQLDAVLKNGPEFLKQHLAQIVKVREKVEQDFRAMLLPSLPNR